jgi:hypothetical protein
MTDNSAGVSASSTAEKTVNLAEANAAPPTGPPKPTSWFLWILVFLILALITLLILTFLSLRDPAFQSREPRAPARGCCRPTQARCGSAPCGCGNTNVAAMTATGAAASAGAPLWPGRRAPASPLKPVDLAPPPAPNEIPPLADAPARA